MLQNTIATLDILFAYYLLATPGSVKEQVLEAAIAEWQAQLEQELSHDN
jgi:hypothetical protein